MSEQVASLDSLRLEAVKVRYCRPSVLLGFIMQRFRDSTAVPTPKTIKRVVLTDARVATSI